MFEGTEIDGSTLCMVTIAFFAFCGTECNIDHRPKLQLILSPRDLKKITKDEKEKKKREKWHVIGDHLVVELTATTNPNRRSHPGPRIPGDTT